MSKLRDTFAFKLSTRPNIPQFNTTTMASVAKGSASYKKKDGSLLLEKDSVTWTPAKAEAPSLKIPVSTITSMSLNTHSTSPAIC